MICASQAAQSVVSSYFDLHDSLIN